MRDIKLTTLSPTSSWSEFCALKLIRTQGGDPGQFTPGEAEPGSNGDISSPAKRLGYSVLHREVHHKGGGARRSRRGNPRK